MDKLPDCDSGICEIVPHQTHKNALVAQLEERQNTNLEVVGSMPIKGSKCPCDICKLAQLPVLDTGFLSVRIRSGVLKVKCPCGQFGKGAGFKTQRFCEFEPHLGHLNRGNG